MQSGLSASIHIGIWQIDNLLNLKLSIRMRKKDDVSDFECGMVVVSTQVCLRFGEIVAPLGILRVHRERSKKEKIFLSENTMFIKEFRL